jgi:hypothetical protein
MTVFVGNTDSGWYRFFSQPGETAKDDFWWPSGRNTLRARNPLLDLLRLTVVRQSRSVFSDHRGGLLFSVGISWPMP